MPEEDSITTWKSDFNADGETSIGLEGQILLRHLLGTFPGPALSQNIQGLASESHMLVGNGTSTGQLDSWLEHGKAVGGFGGNISEPLNALNEGLSFIESL